jgi:Phage integrase family
MRFMCGRPIDSRCHNKELQPRKDFVCLGCENCKESVNVWIVFFTGDLLSVFCALTNRVGAGRLDEALRQWQRVSGGSGAGLVFGEFRYREPFERARKAAGLGKDVLFHSLRHTYVSRLVMAGVDRRTVQELAGHKIISMTMRYAHLGPEQKRRAIGLLDGVLEAKVPTKSPTVVVLLVMQVAARAAI